MSYDLLPDELQRALKRLDEYLSQRGACLKLLLGGASAMRIQLITSRESKDLDNLIRLNSEVIDDIAKIADEFGLESDWLNDQASDIPLPEGAEIRIEEINSPCKRIAITTLSRIDLLSMKVNAAVTRGEGRDYDDLKESSITKDEFQTAIKYILEKQRPDDKEFKNYQDADIESLRLLLFGASK